MLHDSPNQTRLLAKLIWELLSQQRFTSLSDLTAALKDRCARLKLKVTDDAINGAFTLIASNTPLVSEPKQPSSQESTTAASTAPILSHAEAARVLRGWGISVRGGRIVSAAAVQDDGPEDFPRLMVIS